MPRPTVKSLNEELLDAELKYASLEKSFENLSNGYAQGVKRITEQREEIEKERRKAYAAELRADEAERQLKKAQQAAARYADANAKALDLLQWMTENDREPDE